MRDGSLTAEQVAELTRLAYSKMPPHEIADRLGLSRNVVRVRLCRMRKQKIFDVPYAAKNFPISDAEVLAFFKLHKNKTVAQIHRDTGHARDYITRLLARWARM